LLVDRSDLLIEKHLLLLLQILDLNLVLQVVGGERVILAVKLVGRHIYRVPVSLRLLTSSQVGGRVRSRAGRKTHVLGWLETWRLELTDG